MADLVTARPALNVGLPMVSRGEGADFGIDDYRAVRGQIAGRDTLRIYKILLATGLRPSAVLELRKSDVQSEYSQTLGVTMVALRARVLKKAGNRHADGLVVYTYKYLPQSLGMDIDHWSKDLAHPDAWLWPGRLYRGVVRHKGLEQLEFELAEAGRAALGRRVLPSDLRKLAADLFNMIGARLGVPEMLDDRTAQVMLDHEDVGTTRRHYTRKQGTSGALRLRELQMRIAQEMEQVV